MGTWVCEMNSDILNEGIASIEIAFSLIEFSYRIHLKQNIISGLFFNKLEVNGVLVEGKHMTADDVHDFILNHLNSAICSFWIAVDEAFDKVFGKKRPKIDSVIDDFRAVIYMFRCAFSHEISEPKWHVYDPSYRRRPYCLLVPIDCRDAGVEEFHFDFSSLNGKNVKTEAFKYFKGLFTLSKMAYKFLRNETQAQ